MDPEPESPANESLLRSPNSLNSWHHSDMLSSSSSPSSNQDDSGGLSEFENDRTEYPGNREHLTTERLTAITDHLVMPRLPILSTPSIGSSRPVSFRRSRCSSTPEDSACSSPFAHLPSGPSSSSSSSRPHYSRRNSGSNSSILILGHAHTAHGVGPFHDLLSSSLSLASIGSLRSVRILREGFFLIIKFTDSRNDNESIIEEIEKPFKRLKSVVNPKTCYRYINPLNNTTTNTLTRDDLVNIVNQFIENESYLLLFVEIDSFPIPPKKLEFMRTLSRLIPMIPYISEQMNSKEAINGEAILSRQLKANRIRHFPIPNSNTNSSYKLPDREECLRRSSRFCLDWLAIEFASCRHDSSSEDSDHGGDQVLLHHHSTDDFEADMVSERVDHIRTRRRTRRTRTSGCENRTSHLKINKSSNSERPILTIIDQRLSTDNPSITNKIKHLECVYSSNNMIGLPSFTGLLRLLIRQINRDSRFIFKKMLTGVLDVRNRPNDSQDNQHQPDQKHSSNLDFQNTYLLN
ncbi:hypothetical protein H4Q26_012071 [Puccinia striiformis f. sp. tritici PST-130]|nr:hypothetical protein H4Q26_012071 [Puccinia striiformis f. sp. tritici PST-130]